ncbi:MAG: hypothetical protein ACHQQQ_05660 [Bacteroidota bacterium]
MGITDFLGWNVIIVGAGFIAILIYLIVLFQRRRKKNPEQIVKKK